MQTATDQDDPDLQALKKNYVFSDFLGLVAGLVPFVLSFSTTTSTSSTTSADGGFSMGTTTTKHMDYVALGGGGIAILCALIGLAFIGKVKSRGARLGIFAALVALGVLQIARGVIA